MNLQIIGRIIGMRFNGVDCEAKINGTIICTVNQGEE